MNEACIWQYIFLGEVGGGRKGGGGNDVDIILGGVVTSDNLGKSDYIISECSWLCDS